MSTQTTDQTVSDDTTLAGQFIGRDEILQALEERDPQSILNTDYVVQHFDDAVFQSANAGEMSAEFVIVTRNSKPNRQGNQVQILPGPNGKGIVTDFYAKNPVVLYDHGLSGLTLPVGLSQSPTGALSLKMSANKVLATCYFSKLPHAEPIFAAVNERLLRMASISYITSKAMSLDVTQEKLAAGVEAWRQWRGYDFVETEMTEWSVTSIGADRGSLRQALDRGKIHDVKIPLYLRQSWERHADRRQTQGVGWTPPGQQQSASIDLGTLFKDLTPDQSVERLREVVKIGERQWAQDKKTAGVFESVVKSIEQSLAEPVIEPQTQAPTPAPAPESLTPDLIAQHVQKAWHEADDSGAVATQIQQALARGVMPAVNQLLAEVRTEQQQLSKRLDNILGRID